MIDRVTLRLEGLMLERFIDRALAEGVRFERVRHEGRRRLLLCTNPFGARKTLALAEQFGLNCGIVRESGPHAIARRLARRWTLIVAALVCATFLALFLSRIWIIDVSIAGEGPVGDTISCALRALGVVPGAARNTVDPEALELTLAAACDGFSYVGVRLQGVRLLVEAAPEVEAPEIYDPDTVRDLVAAADGIVLSVDARAGKASVAAGETVRRGQVLIRGEERQTREEMRGVQSLGEVIARTRYTGTAEAPLEEIRRVYTGRTSTSAVLRLLDWRLPLTEGEVLSPAEVFNEVLPVGGLFLPLVIERTTCRAYREERVPVDDAALRRKLAERAFATAEAEMLACTDPAAEIADRWIDYSVTAGSELLARAVLEVHQNIAVRRDALYQGGK